MDLRPWLAVVVAAAVHTIGCIGGGCGVGPAPGPNNQNGTVTFDAEKVGASEELPVPFEDSADVTDTITSATITGPDAAAFEVISTFPMTVPAGTQVMVGIRFAPEHAGSSTATLVLETQMMGPSPVDLEGTGIAAGG
jgi:hypothetical protein